MHILFRLHCIFLTVSYRSCVVVQNCSMMLSCLFLWTVAHYAGSNLQNKLMRKRMTPHALQLTWLRHKRGLSKRLRILKMANTRRLKELGPVITDAFLLLSM
jgi:hypothetical protein